MKLRREDKEVAHGIDHRARKWQNHILNSNSEPIYKIFFFFFLLLPPTPFLPTIGLIQDLIQFLKIWLVNIFYQYIFPFKNYLIFIHAFIELYTFNILCQAPLSMGILQARILEWVAMPSSRRCFWLRDWAQVSHIAGGYFTIWATKEALNSV